MQKQIKAFSTNTQKFQNKIHLDLDFINTNNNNKKREKTTNRICLNTFVFNKLIKFKLKTK